MVRFPVHPANPARRRPRAQPVSRPLSGPAWQCRPFSSVRFTPPPSSASPAPRFAGAGANMRRGHGWRNCAISPAVLEQRVEERTAEHEHAVAQLHEAQKLETLGQLTGGVAHDFNNLLTPITGALDMLQRKYGDEDPSIGPAGRQCAAGGRPCHDPGPAPARLRPAADSADPRRRSARPCSTGMRDLITSAVGPTIEVHVRGEADLAPALADPNQLELAILNLCVNARDAMPRGRRADHR